MEKEYAILKHIEELYKGDIEDEDFMLLCQGKETKLAAWREAFNEYSLSDVLDKIDEFYVKKSSKTRPNIAQIRALLNAGGVEKEKTVEASSETYLPDLDSRYMHEDVENGNCHHNKYYYTEALKRIRNNEYQFISDIINPTKSEMIEVIEEICEQRTGKKWEFLSKNDLISQGYDMSKRYSVDDLMKSMFKRV